MRSEQKIMNMFFVHDMISTTDIQYGVFAFVGTLANVVNLRELRIINTAQKLIYGTYRTLKIE